MATGKQDTRSNEASLPKRSRTRAHVLIVGLIVVGVLAALWARRAFLSPPAERAGDTFVADESPRPRVRPAPPSTAPGIDLIGDAMRESGLGPITNHPAGIQPPSGTRNGMERQVRNAGWVHLEANYDCPGTVDEVTGYYHRQAVRKGFQPVSDSVGPLGWRRVLFTKGQMRLIVVLRKRGDKHKIVSVVATLIRPVE